jgi:hypothetical protein
MATEGKKKNPRRMQAIAWRDGREKEIVVKCLNKPNVTKHQPSGIVGNAGKQVLWAAQKIRDLAALGVLDECQDTASLFGDPEEVRTLKEQIDTLEEKLKQAQGGEVSYVDTINELTKRIAFYRSVISHSDMEVDEENLKYRKRGSGIWLIPNIG